jgi:hypothetical protein
MSPTYLRNRRIMWLSFAALLVLHHDWWFWSDGRLLFGFLPIGLAYHMGISIAAGLLWGWASHFAWPPELDEDQDEPAASHA